MARQTLATHPNASQAFLFHKVLGNGSTRKTPRATVPVPQAMWHQRQQLQIILLFIFFCEFIFCVANGATSLGSSLALNGSTTLQLNETLVSDDGQFALGYWHNDLESPDTGYNLAIWYAKVSKMTPVWMPKTSIVLSSKAILSLSRDDGLQLQDSISQGSLPVWNTPTKMVNVTMATILNSGNLVLYNSTNHILWESFEQPTNTLLPNQRYSSNNKIMLYSWKDENNYTTGLGQYVMRWNSSNYLELDYLTHWIPLVVYWTSYIPSLSYVGNVTGNGTGNGTTNVIGNTSVVLTSMGEFRASMAPNIYTVIGKSNISTGDYLRRITLDIDGQLRMYSWQIGTSKDWSIEWSAVSSTCDIIGWCGPFAVCVLGDCQCPHGFNWIDASNTKKGCVRVKPPYFCNDTHIVDDLVPFPGDYPWGTDNNYFPNVTLEACQQECLKDCLCQCATTSYPDVNGNLRCWLKGNILINGVYKNDRTSYVRMAPTFIGKSKRKLSYSTARLIIFIIGPIMVIFGLISCVLGWFFIFKWIKYYQLYMLKKKWRIAHGTTVRFTYNEIQIITQNFSEIIGKGGYGTVYKGVIETDDTKVLVAVKQLGKLDQGVKTFITEVDVIGSIHHIHLIHLLGYCADAHHKVLVYEYMEKCSLDKLLFRDDKSMPILEWRPRFNIAIQTARGLAYLHDDIRDQRIIHCDVKPENILIDSTYSAKVADFGLSRILNREQSLTMTTHIRGTCGYLAPEWTSNHTPITPKTDVYSFGMVLFEIISGSRNTKLSTTESSINNSSITSSSTFNDTKNGYFPLLAYSKLNESNFNILEVLDPSLTGLADHNEVERVLRVAFWCINNNHQLRPSMSKVVQMLEGHIPIELPLPQPNFNDKFLSDSTDSPIILKEILM
ncbi:hypothetical protein M758_8G062600 [Ceratodon purpureus]|uniref:Receptor-like serine/threonine-protein kinase n=1 Tax=Ceratodon purpureus TaxID=3225 RepID=A0A8T0H450_CERPU|nr:hypothetical protein KC19_8G066200 [Ceratodon purpureus]KAG0607887.1 hypothetical protein M758_8G062600 [Ceratodon purpureus]